MRDVLEIERFADGSIVIRDLLTPRNSRAFTEIAPMVAFMRERMKQDANPTAHDRAVIKEKFERFLAVTDGDVPPPRSMDEPKECLDKLQDEGQKWDSSKVELAWKRAKEGDWVKVKCGKTEKAGKVLEGIPNADYFFMLVQSSPDDLTCVHRDRIIAILPTPHRHGDFGSRPEEDGA